MELLTEGDHLIIYARARASRPHLRVDVISHIEHRGALGKFQQVALGSEHIYLVVIEVHLKLVHRLHTASVLQHLTDAVEPFVHAAFRRLHALVAPVGCDASFGNIVHALRAYLHLHPFLFGTQHGDVQAFVAVRLRHAEPVAHTFGVRGVHIRDDGKRLPALLFLLFYRTVDDDADGKEVVHALEGTFLLLHLLPDRVDTLRASLHMELQSGILQLLLNRTDKLLYVFVACLFGGVQFLLDVIVGIVLQVFQRQVLQFALQLVQAQLMGQGCIEVGRLFTDAPLGLLIIRVPDLSHQVHAVCYHDENHAHILCKRKQQVAEVLALDNGILLIQFLYALQPVQDTSYGDAIGGTHLVDRQESCLYAGVQQDCQYGIAT